MGYQRRGPAAWALHPGEILREEFLKPLDMSVYALAKALHVPAQGINDIVLEKRGISPETAIRLGKFLGTSEEFWMNLQTGYELALARKKVAKQIKKIKPHEAA